MAPKKKPLGKKRVFTLKNEALSQAVSKSSWQSKYQELLPFEALSSKNGSSNNISSTTTAQLGGLVGDYSSDTDEDSQQPMDSKIKDFMKEIDHIDEEPVATTSQTPVVNSNGTNYSGQTSNWVQFFDEETGYPYYWNQLTNSVSWQLPAEHNMLQTHSPAPSIHIPKPNSKPVKKKNPWEGNSDSEDEKIEMITSFQTPDDSDSEPKSFTSTKKKSRSRLTKKSREREVAGPQLPPNAEENQESYETSSLMTLLVPDEGPPGVEPSKQIDAYKSVDTPDSGVYPEINESNGIPLSDNNINQVVDTSEVNFTNDVSIVPEYSPLPSNVIDNDSMDTRMTDEKNDCELADEILAEIEKEIPPDFVEPKISKKEVKNAPTSFALIASYGDDSDPEDVDMINDNEEIKAEVKPPCLFPSTSQQSSSSETQPKPLFPIDINETTVVEPVAVVPPNIERSTVAVASSSSTVPNPLLDANLPDSTTTHKAFKRKKRIELTEGKKEVEAVSEQVAGSRTIPGSSSFILFPNRAEPVADFGPVSDSNPRYNMDPTSGEHRGFGFSIKELPSGNEKKSKGIQFIKAETLSFKSTTEHTSNSSHSLSNSPVPTQDLVDGAALLREKLTFLGEGSDEVSAVQKMAIQLEIFVSAWQSGALTPAYLCQWLGSRAVEISKNEEAAAPPGWICEWERETKRYRYRNLSNGAITWEYPEEGVQQLEGDAVQDVEMEISDTPPRISPSRNDPDPETAEMVPPPPPVISRSNTPPPPPPPVITCPEPPPPPSKLSSEQVTSSSEDMPLIPPLPPGPYPPPPPDEPPPPGVDDGDVTYQHHASSNHTFPLTPSPPDSSSQVQAEIDRPSSSRVTSVSSSNIAEVTTSMQNGNKRCLISELDSFYMDIAKLDTTESAVANDTGSYAGTPLVQDVPIAVSSSPSASKLHQANSLDRSSSPKPPRLNQSSVVEDSTAKKRKKNKLGAGLTLKKKGVSTLVAKWQQVRDEARKNYSSEEEENDDVSSTYK